MARYRDIEEDKKKVLEMTLAQEPKKKDDYQGTIDAVKKGDPKVRAAVARAFK